MKKLVFAVLFLGNWVWAQSDTLELDSIFIKDKQSEYRLSEVNNTGIFAAKKTEVINMEQVKGNVSMLNARQIFAQIPGLTVWESDASGQQINIATRGLSPNRSWEFNVRQNGYDVSADVFGYPEAYFNPPMEGVAEIQVVRGAAGLQYGPQFGGMINYKMKRGDANRPFTFQTTNTLGGNSMISTFNAVGGTKGKWNYYGYLHKRRGNGWRENSAFNISNGYGSLYYQANPNLNVGIELTGMTYTNQQAGGLTDLQYKSNPRQSVRARNWMNIPWLNTALVLDYKKGNHTLSAKIYNIWGQRNSIGFTTTPNVLDTINHNTFAFNPRQIDRFYFLNTGIEVRHLWKYRLGNQDHALASGIRLYNASQERFQRGKGDSQELFNLLLQTEYFPFEMQFSTQNAAVFSENLFHYNRFSFTTGLRYEYIASSAQGRLGIANDGSFQTISPVSRNRSIVLGGIGAEYHLTEDMEIYANLSQSYRPVTFAEITPPATTDVVDANLKDARGASADLGIRGDYKNYLHFDLSLFGLNYKNRIGTLTQYLPDSSRTQQFRTNVGDSYSRGIEAFVALHPLQIFAKNRLHDWQITASLSWIDAKYKDFLINKLSANGEIISSNLSGKYVEYAPRYVHRLGTSYAYKNISFSVQYNAVSDIFTDANNTEVANSSGTIGALKGYQVWDIWAKAKLWNNYEVLGGVNNLFNTTYATRRSSGYPGPGILPADGRTWFVTFQRLF